MIVWRADLSQITSVICITTLSAVQRYQNNHTCKQGESSQAKQLYVPRLTCNMTISRVPCRAFSGSEAVQYSTVTPWSDMLSLSKSVATGVPRHTWGFSSAKKGVRISSFTCIPGPEILEVVEDVSPEGLQHVSLDVFSWEQRQHLAGQLGSLPMYVQRELSSGVCAIAGQHDLRVLPRCRDVLDLC